MSEARQLFELCRSDRRVWEFVEYSVRANAARLDNAYHDHGGIIEFDPPWLLRVSREILRVLDKRTE